MRFSILNRIGLIASIKEGKTYFFVKNLVGSKPHNISLYRLAFTHKSRINIDDVHDDYERLEFLGDAILDAIH